MGYSHRHFIHPRSDSTLQRMEMGEQNVTLKTLEQICTRLKCTVTEMFGEE